MPGTVLGSEDRAVNKTKVLAFEEFIFKCGYMDSKVNI